MTQAVIPSLRPNMGYAQIKGAFKVALTPGAVGAGATVTLTPTVPSYVKCDLGDIVLMAYDHDQAGCDFQAYVSAQNTIKIIVTNTSAGSITPANGNAFLIVIPQELGEFIA